MPDKHALLGPSSAHIWSVCPPSARLGETFVDKGSKYAEEGTEAHSLCEKKLRILNGDTPDVFLDANDYDKEMWNYSEQYADFVKQEWEEAKLTTPDAKLFVEVELDLSDYVPESFGTSDAVIVSDDVLEIIDFKYGKGVAVDPTNNPQLRLYALGAYLKYSQWYCCSTIKTSVFQPRISNVGSETITVDELLAWADGIKQQAALAWKGVGKFCVGAHCRFCKAGGTCRARAEDAFAVIDHADTKPSLLGDDEIPAILDRLDNAERWIDALRKYAENKAILNGKKWDGWKLVEARTQRKISDPIKAVSVLTEAGYRTEEVTDLKIKSLTSLEKLLGKEQFSELLGALVVKPEGAPTLVPDSDKREEIQTIQEIFKEEQN